MAFIKHVGTHKGTNTRLSVVFLSLPDDKENALVVYSDSLPEKYHDDFMSALESKEGQSSAQLYEVLSRKVFHNGNNMLETLHKEGLMKKMPVDQIIMSPNSTTQISLVDLLAQMEDLDQTVAAPAGQTVQENVTEQVDMAAQGDHKKIAQNLLVQAVMLEQEAERKRAEAVKYDPTLTEKAEKPAKKGRGRPAGTTAKAMAARAEAAAPAE
jgi:hypothetical protein|tara:strand:- start:416 stop:1051 length:636 start_codon:yes stop_codon:yes gene_type:complete